MKKILLFFICGILCISSKNNSTLFTELTKLKEVLEQIDQQLIPSKQAPWKVINQELLIDTIQSIWDYKREEFSEKLISKEVGERLQEANLSSSISPATTENVNQLKDMLQRLLTKALVSPEGLLLCLCINMGKRLTFIIELIQAIKQQYPNHKDLITYTSLGSGGLLQDYLTISELIATGYAQIKINIIDLEYPDITQLARTAREQQAIHAASLSKQSAERQAIRIDIFKINLTKDISVKELENPQYKGSVEVHIYSNAYNYINKAKQYDYEKTNILILVDPGWGLFATPDFPSLANVLAIDSTDPSSLKPAFYLFIPQHHAAQLYYLPDKDPKLYTKLREIINKTGAKTHYTSSLVHNIFAEEIGKSNIAIKTDPYVTFQDMVWSILTPNPVVFTLHHMDLRNEFNRESSRIIRVNVDDYKEKDIIGPLTGNYLEENGYKKDDF